MPTCATHMMVPEEREQQPRCADCGNRAEGELFLYPTDRALDGGETVGLCAECFIRKGVDEDSLVVTRLHAGVPAESSDERFEALTAAARVLLRKRIADEDKIIPTLRLAHKRGWRAPRILYEAVRLVEVVEDVPILERVGVKVRGHRSLEAGDLTDFAISLFPRSKTATAKEIANAYEKALRAEEVKWGQGGGRISYDLHQVRGYYLLLTVERTWFSERRQGDWPSPSLVGKVARAALEEVSERLVIRQSGPKMEPENLIPAIVAYLMSRSLPTDTEIAGRKEIHRLLNEYVLCQTSWKRSLPEGSYANTSEIVQLWRDVGKIALMEERIPDRGPYEIKEVY
jgi:hypothetical protein